MKSLRVPQSRAWQEEAKKMSKQDEHAIRAESLSQRNNIELISGRLRLAMLRRAVKRSLIKIMLLLQVKTKRQQAARARLSQQLRKTVALRFRSGSPRQHCGG
jgi:hypothetical protein